MNTTVLKSFQSALIVACLTLLIVTTTCHSQTSPGSLSINFDSETSGTAPTTPSGWSFTGQATTPPGTMLVTNVQSASALNSLEFKTFGPYTTGGDAAWLLSQHAFLPDSVKDQFSFNIRFSSVTDHQFRFSIDGSTNNPAMQLVFNGGNLKVESGLGWTVFNTIYSNLVANQWYTVIVDTVPSSGTFSVSLSQGANVLASISNLSYVNGPISLYGACFVSDGSITATTLTQSAYVDDIAMGPASAVAGPTHLFLDFESDPVNAQPLGSAVTVDSGSGSALITNTKAFTGSQSLCLAAPAGIVSAYFDNYYLDILGGAAMTLGQTVLYHAQIAACPAQTNGVLYVRIGEGGGYNAAIIRFDSDGKVYAQVLNGSTVLLPSYTANQWYLLDFLFSTGDPHYTVTISDPNGNPLSIPTFCTWYNSPSPMIPVNGFSFAAVNGTLYVDSLKIYEVFNPTATLAWPRALISY